MSNTGLTNFGTCWSCVSDLSSPAVMVSGNQVVAEAILRRWGTSPGELIDDPDYGFNLSDLISDDLGPADIALAQQQAGAEAEKDERVLSATVTLTLNNATGVLTVNALVVTSLGPFTLVASVSAIGTALLLVSP
jgi:hypothetical protein